MKGFDPLQMLTVFYIYIYIYTVYIYIYIYLCLYVCMFVNFCIYFLWLESSKVKFT